MVAFLSNFFQNNYVTFPVTTCSPAKNIILKHHTKANQQISYFNKQWYYNSTALLLKCLASLVVQQEHHHVALPDHDL